MKGGGTEGGVAGWGSRREFELDRQDPGLFPDSIAHIFDNMTV